VTPGGDGIRTFPYMQFVNNAKSFYPLWDPYRLGGIPTLADPARFIYLGKWISTESDWANLQLNSAILVVMITISFSAYLLARELRISQQGAVIVALVLPWSWFFTRWMHCGRITVIITFAVINFTLYFYAKYLKNKGSVFLFLASVLTGFTLSSLGYYSLVMLLPSLVAFGWYHNRIENNLRIAFQKTAIQVATMHVVGALSFAVCLLPMVTYLSQDYVDTAPFRMLGETLPQLGSIANIFLPVRDNYASNVFPFVSLITIPLLTFLVIKRDKTVKKEVNIFVCLAVASFCILIGSVYPSKLVVRVLENTPILMQIRASHCFYYVLTFSIAFLCGYSWDAIEVDDSGRQLRKLTPLCAVLIVGVVTILFDVIGSYAISDITSLRDYMRQSFIFNGQWQKPWKYVPVLILLVVPFTNLKKREYIKICILMLFAAQIVLFRLENNMKPARNEVRLPRIARVLNNDGSYYSLWGLGHWAQTSIGMPKVRSLKAFSLYFSREHRWQLENLFQKEITALRPHWVGTVPFHSWDSKTIEMLNIKYILTPYRYGKGSDGITLLRKDWEFVEEDRIGVKLWKRKNWKSSLQIIDEWEVVPSPRDSVRKTREPDYKPFEMVFLEREPAITADDKDIDNEYEVEILEYDSDEVIFWVRSNKNGILFIPEYYDKGWKAVVNGREPRDVIRANGSFRGIPIERGSHTIRMYYSPRIVFVGACITAITVLASILLVILQRIKRKSSHCKKGLSQAG
jgi:hypothetical protein